MRLKNEVEKLGRRNWEATLYINLNTKEEGIVADKYWDIVEELYNKTGERFDQFEDDRLQFTFADEFETEAEAIEALRVLRADLKGYKIA
jgi:hypothetical protein